MADPVVHYTITPIDPAAHLFRVTLVVRDPNPAGQALRLPAWIPGSYMIREFAKHIVALEASDPSGPVAVHKTDKDTWLAAPCTGPLTVCYDVYAWDLSVRAAHLDDTHGFFNGTSVFLAPVGQEHGTMLVDIEPPPSDVGSWEVATTLPRAGAAPWGFGRYRAADYDALIDHPVEMGTFTRTQFLAHGVPHDVVITGQHRCDLDRLCADLTPICETHITMFGRPAPVDRYLFLVMAVGDGYGGLEHRASTALICKRDDLPQVGVDAVSDGYRTFLGLCSHEYFHTWNVKRIKPAAFVPYDLSQEQHTTLLWAFEGITSYYDDLALVRSGRIPAKDWLTLLGRTITRVHRGAGRRKQSLADSSFDAWTKFYRQDENAPNAIVSYYAKGALAALALDLHLRETTDDRVTLDDVMRALWERFGKGQGVPEADVEAVASELAGADLTAFFDAAVRGTDDLPLPQLLARMGITLSFRAQEGDKDRGGTAPKKASKRADAGSLGARVGKAAHGAKLTHVLDDGAARAAGLSAGDVIVAVDDLRVTGATLTERIQRYGAGETLTVHAFRRDELQTRQVTLQAPPADTAWLTFDADADATTVARRQAWLGSPDAP